MRRWEGPFTASNILQKSFKVTDGPKRKAFPLETFIPPDPSELDPEQAGLTSSSIRKRKDVNSATHIVDEFRSTDPSASYPECVATVESEQNGLSSIDVFTFVPRRYLPAKVTFLGKQIIRCVKNVGTPD